MIPRQELPSPQVFPVTAAVLAAIVVAGKQEGICNLPAKAPRDMHEAHEPNDGGRRKVIPFGPEAVLGVHLQDFGLAVEDEADRSTSRNEGQRFVRCI